MSRRLAVAVVTLAVVAAGCAAGPSTTTVAASPATPPPTSSATPSSTPPATPPSTPPATPSSTPPATPSSTPPATPPSTVDADAFPTGIVPARLVIDAIDVDAPVVDLALTATEVEVPAGDDDAGWWTATRRPGELGPAVIGGHVDSTDGPAVFFRLRELATGDRIVVEAADGEARSFVVRRVQQLAKGADPRAIFGIDGDRPQLRLVTCGGQFDRTTGHYTDNLVVHAGAAA